MRINIVFQIAQAPESFARALGFGYFNGVFESVCVFSLIKENSYKQKFCNLYENCLKLIWQYEKKMCINNILDLDEKQQKHRHVNKSLRSKYIIIVETVFQIYSAI